MDWKQKTWLELLDKQFLPSTRKWSQTLQTFFSVSFNAWCGNWSTLYITSMVTAFCLWRSYDHDLLYKNDPPFPSEHMEHGVSASPLFYPAFRKRKSFCRGFHGIPASPESHALTALGHLLPSSLPSWQNSLSSVEYFSEQYRVAPWDKTFELTGDSWVCLFFFFFWDNSSDIC